MSSRMANVLLAAHNDDECLFAAHVCARFEPHVIVCLRSDAQAQRGLPITYEMREKETEEAMRVFGLDWTQWPFPDSKPNPGELKRAMRTIEADVGFVPRRVFAPLPEDGGHEQHNLIGELAHEVFGDRVRFYSTYRRGLGKSRAGREIVMEPEWIVLKLQALQCYRTQIMEPSTRPWFLEDLKEYLTP